MNSLILFFLILKIEIGHLMMPNRFGRNFELGESSNRNEGGQQPQPSFSGRIRQQRRGWEKSGK